MCGSAGTRATRMRTSRRGESVSALSGPSNPQVLGLLISDSLVLATLRYDSRAAGR